MTAHLGQSLHDLCVKLFHVHAPAVDINYRTQQSDPEKDYTEAVRIVTHLREHSFRGMCIFPHGRVAIQMAVETPRAVPLAVLEPRGVRLGLRPGAFGADEAKAKEVDLG